MLQMMNASSMMSIVSNKKKKISLKQENLLERAGPREKIFFDPSKVHAGIVTCGGLCPGLNDVIRAIVMCLWNRYKVRQIAGIKFGYKGFLPEYELPVIRLNPQVVDDIHRKGGTILGSSRGDGNRVEEIVDAIERMNLNVIFAIGGDGTLKGALDIAKEIEKRGLKIAIVGVPKTIDNDISFIQRTFGFETAVSKAVEAVSAAHMEASNAINGIGLVNVMGRESGFIAAHTALAMNDVDFVLIPEVSFDLKGSNGLLHHLKRKLQEQGHVVILVAEGAGQDLIPKQNKQDESGNLKLGKIGEFLKMSILLHFNRIKTNVTLKYIDPSYIIRSSPANPNDSLYCARLGYHAVHAAMAGKTKLVISLINNHFVHVPIKMAVTTRNKVDPEGSLWRDVVEACGQPLELINK